MGLFFGEIMKLFTEWMSFRQGSEQPQSGEFVFSGTFTRESIPDLVENSDSLNLEDALKLIPEKYNIQFSNTEKLSAGKSHIEENKEVIWINNENTDVVYVFEKA
jgi:hypothetical protein